MKARKSAARAEPVGVPLPTLNDGEMDQAYERAHHAGKLHQPYYLRTVWDQRKKMVGAAGVQELVRIIRAGASSRKLDEPELAALLVATLIQETVERFELLVQTGTMDSVVPSLKALPLLYSTKAGKGAPEWRWARKLFES